LDTRPAFSVGPALPLQPKIETQSRAGAAVSMNLGMISSLFRASDHSGDFLLLEQARCRSASSAGAQVFIAKRVFITLTLPSGFAQHCLRFADAAVATCPSGRVECSIHFAPGASLAFAGGRPPPACVDARCARLSQPCAIRARPCPARA